MVLRACRYFGHTRDYWWANLTWPLYAELTQQLADEPPADRLLALYFFANKWWAPPEVTGGAAVATSASAAEVWDCQLPDFTE